MGAAKTKDVQSLLTNVILDHLAATYFDDCIVTFELSYNGAEWDRFVIVACITPNFDSIEYIDDWCEGQTYIRNIRIKQLSDIVIDGYTYYAE